MTFNNDAHIFAFEANGGFMPKEKKKTVAVSLSSELLQALEKKKKTYESRSALFERLLRKSLKMEKSDGN